MSRPSNEVLKLRERIEDLERKLCMALQDHSYNGATAMAWCSRANRYKHELTRAFEELGVSPDGHLADHIQTLKTRLLATEKELRDVANR